MSDAQMQNRHAAVWITSCELSKRLRAVGVPQGISRHFWSASWKGGSWDLRSESVRLEISSPDMCSAFDIAELTEFFPPFIDVSSDETNTARKVGILGGFFKSVCHRFRNMCSRSSREAEKQKRDLAAFHIEINQQKETTAYRCGYVAGGHAWVCGAGPNDPNSNKPYSLAECLGSLLATLIEMRKIDPLHNPFAERRRRFEQWDQKDLGLIQ